MSFDHCTCFNDRLIRVFRTQLGLVLVHLCLEGSTPETRREVNAVVERSIAALPELTNRVVRDGLTAFLARGPPASKAFTTTSVDETSVSWNKHSRLSNLLLSAVSFVEDTEPNVKEVIVVHSILLSHHHLICMAYYPPYDCTYWFQSFRWEFSPDMDRSVSASAYGST